MVTTEKRDENRAVVLSGVELLNEYFSGSRAAYYSLHWSLDPEVQQGQPDDLVDWLNRVTKPIQSPGSGILDQIFGSYHTGLNRLHLSNVFGTHYSYGFGAVSPEHGEALDAAWQYQVDFLKGVK